MHYGASYQPIRGNCQLFEVVQCTFGQSNQLTWCDQPAGHDATKVLYASLFGLDEKFSPPSLSLHRQAAASPFKFCEPSKHITQPQCHLQFTT